MIENIYDYLKLLQKIEIGFETNNNNYTSLKSYIKDMTDEAILIDPPNSQGVTYNLPVGQMINLIVYIPNNGLCIGESKIIGKELSKISGLWISYPLSSQIVQRREFLRVPMVCKLEISVFKDVNHSQKEEFNVLTKDISGNGLSYISDEPLNDYYDIICRINLNNEIIEAKCDHIYSHLTFINNEPKYINAFTFVDIPQRDVRKLVQTCFKYQLELHKKGFIE